MATGQGNLTTYGANALLNATVTIGGGTFYVALFTADPTTAGDTTNELSGGGYARQPVTFPTASTGSVSNPSDITFAPWTGATTTETFIGLMDAATGGNMIARVLSSPSETLTSGANDEIIIKSGTLVFSLVQYNG
ncbi:phage tail fiber protein [Alicyclobacillus sp. ALC3]|uniref:phage tail fiber protein n=1 Tax=Alicyclobacillus sp. ALC3 TaxID=2796143 RepID=UPI0023784595|nr:hypothetical protein [Alicyclobacillus sp. ALC3]WDL97794.1 hypothetical protein JC200_03425 [Alicyclobacillus sp. ALC3]